MVFGFANRINLVYAKYKNICEDNALWMYYMLSKYFIQSIKYFN